MDTAEIVEAINQEVRRHHSGKFASAAVILLFCSVLTAAGQAKRPIPQQREVPKLSTMIDRVRPSVVQILSFFGPTIADSETGTGFFVSPNGIVVTAKHVISSQPNIPCDTSPLKQQQAPEVSMPEPKPVQASKIIIELPQVPQHLGHVTIMASFIGVRARVLACDDKHDIAVLEPERNPLTMSDQTFPPLVETGDKKILAQSGKREAAILSATAFRDGDPVFTSGYPLGNTTLITTSGYIASSAPIGVNEQTGKFEDVYWADINVNPGDSGGPAFSLETGTVLGMILAVQFAPVLFEDDHSKAFLPAQTPNHQVIARYLGSNSGITEIIPVEFVERLLLDNKLKFATR